MQYCTRCGATIPEGSVFCTSCGTRTDAADGANGNTPPQREASYPNSGVYTQPPRQFNMPLDQPPLEGSRYAEVKTSNFFWSMLVLSLPLVGFVFAIVWAFSSSEAINKRNWARAVLIWQLVGVCLAIVLGIVFAIVGVSTLSWLSNYGYYY